MNILSNEKIKFKSLEENTFKEMMKLGRQIIQDELRMIDSLILKYRDKETFTTKDFEQTTIKTKLGEIPIARRRYKMKINCITKCIYLLDELLKIKVLVDTENNLNLHNKNIFLEDIMANILNILYLLSLCNTNLSISNYAAIDLHDIDNRVAIQVTTNIKK